MRRSLINKEDSVLSLVRQCEILEINRSSLYYEPSAVSEEEQNLLRLIDEEYTRHPFYGSRKILIYLRGLDYVVNRKRVQRLMGILGLQGIISGPNLSKRNQAHKIYPYLLKGVLIVRPNQVWSTDITYIRLLHGFCYCVAIMPVYFVLAAVEQFRDFFLFGGAGGSAEES